MRNLWINLHLYRAVFFAPTLLLLASSGGLSLVDIKGAVSSRPVAVPSGTVINPASPSREADERVLLRNLGIVPDFEYVKKSEDRLLTRPTSRTYYEILLTNNSVEVKWNVPDLQKRLVELHRGHGPLLFEDLQKILAVGLLFLVFSGMWLGLSSPGLRLKTIVAGVGGLLILLILAFVV